MTNEVKCSAMIDQRTGYIAVFFWKTDRLESQ